VPLTLYVRRSDYPGEASWRLAEWCLNRGATEFSLEFLVAGKVGPSSFADIDAVLKPFRVSHAEDRFVLSGDSLVGLRALFPEGLFGNVMDGDAWVEDPTLYRSGVALLEVVSHEGEGILTIDAVDQVSLDALALPYHRRGVWV
jgi:hypothetical protein